MSEFKIAEEGKPIISSNLGRFRAVQFNFSKDNDIGWKETLKILWGFDIWMENVPIVKVLIFANIIVWLLLFGGNSG